MISRSVYGYPSRATDQTPLRLRIKEIAAARVRHGYQRIHVVLRREGWLINRKRVYRLYRQEGLSLFERRPKRHRSAMQRKANPAAHAKNECRSMDFVSDPLYDGRKLRALTLIDAFTRECLAIWVDQGIRGDEVGAYRSFNGRLRQECLNQHWFLSLADARTKIEAWPMAYNECRPHGALGWATPAEFARAVLAARRWAEDCDLKPLVRAICSLALLCFVATPARSEDNRLPEEAASILGKAKQFELLSLDPASGSDKPTGSFRGYRVLGKTTVNDRARKDLAQAFLKGMEGKIDPKRCFKPRHGVRATHDGKTIELVICFECTQFDVYVGSAEKGQRLLVSMRPEPVFDKVLKDAGISKAKALP